MKITIRPGVTMTLTAQSTYQMNYVTGSRTYSEPFIITHFDKPTVDQDLKPFRTVVDGLAAFFVSAGAVGGAGTLGLTAATGALLALVTKVAGPLIEGRLFQLNGDGSLDQYVAYHYWGSRGMGVDPTAWPLPGVPAEQWFGNVNGMIRNFRPNLSSAIKAASKEGPETDAHAALGQEVDRAEGLVADSPAGNPTDVQGIEEDFYSRFEECLSVQGLPAPTSLFGTATAAIASINALYAAVAKFGTAVTLTELVGAGVLSEAFAMLGSITAAWYLGALIGCGARSGIGPYIPAL